jgi:hypothetical protein
MSVHGSVWVNHDMSEMRLYRLKQLKEFLEGTREVGFLAFRGTMPATRTFRRCSSGAIRVMCADVYAALHPCRNFLPACPADYSRSYDRPTVSLALNLN